MERWEDKRIREDVQQGGNEEENTLMLVYEIIKPAPTITMEVKVF